ncbi:hypothetical protein OG896_24855 [Streptomyces sp. NBC_00669]|uniref:hypothetical protein n=1 Tax=Streptomyces sp. NBC_00669 TaxID=2976011 RepID=UPI002E2FB6DA|nr:hypothetical protein [Streptomyces sp. NBC_00669]
MSWDNANQIFDSAAEAMINSGRTPEVKRKVLGHLINLLQDCGWTTEADSLELVRDDPAIVAAFADHDVHLHDDDGLTDSDSAVLALISEIAMQLEDATDDGEYHAAVLIGHLATGRRTVEEARAELAEITLRHV